MVPGSLREDFAIIPATKILGAEVIALNLYEPLSAATLGVLCEAFHRLLQSFVCFNHLRCRGFT